MISNKEALAPVIPIPVAPGGDEIFNPNDFHSYEWSVEFHNVTTNVPARGDAQVSIAEFGEKSLMFDLPKGVCNLRHMVMFKIFKVAEDKKKSLVFSATGKVISLEENDQGRFMVDVELVQYEEKHWTNFLSIFTSRQDEITNFLQAARG